MEKRTYAGIKNDKERSKKKLIDAVGHIIRTEGYSGLKAVAIAEHAGLSRRLIATYFGSLDNLVEIYVRSKDYWTTPSANANEVLENEKTDDTRSILENLLTNQLDYFSREEEWQKIILWQISQRSKIMFEVAEEREKLGARFFELSDPSFEGTDVDLRAVAGLLVGGIYYMVLHAKSNDSLFCQIDLNKPEGLLRVKNAIGQILKDTYRRAELQKTK
jgi:AcrR family transcriptional regulator